MKRRWWRRLFYSRVFSPKGFLSRAAGLAALFLLVHALGWREYTSVLCGTSPTGRAADLKAALFGTAYAGLYFFSVTVVPVLLLGAVIFLLLLRWTGRKGGADLRESE